MKKYFLKPGSYSDSTKLSSSNPPGLNLENYIVSVINNPTCCPKEISGGGGAPSEVLTTYPTTDATKAGTRFIYDGNDWSYMTQAEIDAIGWTGLVSVGFPAPVSKNYNPFIEKNNPTNQYVNSYVPHGVSFLNGYGPITADIDILGLGRPEKYRNYNIGGIYITIIRNAQLLKSLEDAGTGVSLNLNSCNMSDTTINDLFTQLPGTQVSVTINVGNNPGSATCDTTIATAKGYTVII